MRPITRPPIACIQAWPSKPRNLHHRSSDSGARSATAASGCSWAHCSTCIRLRWYRPSIFLPAMAAFKPFTRIPPAARSHLGLVARCARRGRAGVGAGQDCTELAVDLVEPLYLLLDREALHVDVDRWMPACCSMAAATAATMQGIPACCGRSTEAAPRRSTWV